MPKRREELAITNDEDLTPMEQIIETWERYIAALVHAGMHVDAEQSRQLGELAERLAWLHAGEAEECRQMAEFWQQHALSLRPT